MKKLMVLLAVLSLLVLTGCQDIAAALTERQRLERDTQRLETLEAQANADEAEAEADKVKNEWDGRAFFVGTVGATGLAYYFGTLTVVAGTLTFWMFAFFDPQEFRRRWKKKESRDDQ